MGAGAGAGPDIEYTVRLVAGRVSHCMEEDCFSYSTCSPTVGPGWALPVVSLCGFPFDQSTQQRQQPAVQPSHV